MLQRQDHVVFEIADMLDKVRRAIRMYDRLQSTVIPDHHVEPTRWKTVRLESAEEPRNAACVISDDLVYLQRNSKIIKQRKVDTDTTPTTASGGEAVVRWLSG